MSGIFSNAWGCSSGLYIYVHTHAYAHTGAHTGACAHTHTHLYETHWVTKGGDGGMKLEGD